MLEKVEHDIKIALEIFPKLKFKRVSKGIYHINGEIDIFDNNNIYWDSFQIKITTPLNYPYSFPIVYVVGDRIPAKVDRHINADRSCCLDVLNEIILRSEKGITIRQFFTEYVIPFFANQLYFEKNKHWANGDYLHYDDGIVQFYKEQTNLNTIDGILLLLNKIPTIKKMRRNDDCYCNSNLKFKRCHLQSLHKILSLPPEKVIEDIRLIKKLIN